MDDLVPAWRDGELQPLGKLDVHLQGLRHKAVSVFLLADGKLLIQRRALGKYHTPGLWANTCCTHPHWGEDPARCATRRLAQELGITGLEPQPMGQIEYRADVGSGMTEHEVVDLFRIEAPHPPSMAPDTNEVMDVRWVDRDSLISEVERFPTRFTPWLRIYLADHARAIFGGTASSPSS